VASPMAGFPVRMARRGAHRQHVHLTLNLCVRHVSLAEAARLALSRSCGLSEFRHPSRNRGGFLGITPSVSGLLTRRTGAWGEWGSIIGTGPNASENGSSYGTL
jgi:hypothetical protein